MTAAGRDAIAQFVEVAASLTGVPIDDIQQRIGRGDFGAALSTLNNDGSPVELCLSISPSSSTWRLIVDPAFDSLVPFERAARTRVALRETFERAGARGLTDLALLAIDATTENANPWSYRSGVAWLAENLHGSGAAVYIDAAPQRVAKGWEVARQWVRSTLSAAAAALADIDALSLHAQLRSFSVEGISAAHARLKLYFQSRELRPLSDWGPASFRDPRYLQILAIIIGSREVALDGIVGSVGFDVATGARTDSKIDVCGHCVARSSAEWLVTLRAACEAAGITAPALPAVLDRADVAFLGTGFRETGEPRINLYLKPRDVGDTTGRTIGRAVQYLLSIQEDDGSWWDYELPVGRSDAWVTAYAGYALACAGERWPDARRGAERAAAWLEGHRSGAAGWGFNANAGSDADSTAFTLALFRLLGQKAEERDRRLLLEHWKQSGGFSTYLTDDAWGTAHPDVTPLAYRSLTVDEQRERQEALDHFLDRTMMRDGTWPSYWWRYDSYATFAVFEHCGRRPARVPSPDLKSPFDLACCVGISQSSELVTKLMTLQRLDGGWNGGANLRVTERDCYAPWDDARGNYYEDFRSTITTATAIRALLRV